MGRKKSRTSQKHKWPSRQTHIEFVVPDRKSMRAASEAVSRDKIPLVLGLTARSMWMDVAERILRNVRSDSIEIVEDRSLSPEGAYAVNAKTVKAVVGQRNAMIAVITDMVQATIAKVAEDSEKIDDLLEKLDEQEERIRQLEGMMKAAFGKVPKRAVPPGKMLWRGQLQEAALMVRQNYNEDLAKREHQYKDLRDASDNFFENHVFVHKPRLTPNQFYANVKKAA